MSTTYSTIQGDTFDSVARKTYGTAKGSLVRAANPSVSEPIPAGTTVVIPAQQSTPADTVAVTIAGSADTVAVTIAGETLKYWQSIVITRTLDSVDTFALSAPTNRKLQPLSFEEATVSVGGQPLFTGTVLDVTPSINASRGVDEVSGYSLPGVLNDCSMPSSGDPIEYNNQTLEEIAAATLAPFGLEATFAASSGPVFDTVAMEEGSNVLTFLAHLAVERGLVIGTTTSGGLIFHAPTEGAIVADLQEGAPPLVSVQPLFRPQQYYSDVTGVEPSLPGLGAGQKYTVKNTRLPHVVRPYTFIVNDAKQGDLKAAVEAKAARMFAGAVSYTVEVPTWRDSLGGLWSPGGTVQLHAPSAKVNRPYRFLIRSVTFRSSSAGKTAMLTLVLPTVFSGKIPESMPWDE